MPEISGPARIEVLYRRLRDAQSIMGCGDNPDIEQAVAEIERIEAAIGHLESATTAERWTRIATSFG